MASSKQTPHATIEEVVRKLPPRPQEVIMKRFGLLDGVRRTLEEIGREQGITRERVRQIEEDGFRHLRNDDVERRLQPFIARLQAYIGERGNIVPETQIFQELGKEFGPQFTDAKDYHPTLFFLLSYGKQFSRVSKSPKYHAAWATSPQAYDHMREAVERLVKHLNRVRKVHSETDIHGTFHTVSAEVFDTPPSAQALRAYLATSREIHRNPFGEYGLRYWPEVNPRGVRDKAYLVLHRLGKPLHFQEVAHEINRVGFGTRPAHPQTVHNELIKDQRFILVGRGTYALREWGYEPGTVRDVLKKILKTSSEPLNRDEIIKKVMEQRFVKVNTIILNLQNRNHFRRTPDGRYTVAV